MHLQNPALHWFDTHTRRCVLSSSAGEPRRWNSSFPVPAAQALPKAAQTVITPQGTALIPAQQEPQLLQFHLINLGISMALRSQ